MVENDRVLDLLVEWDVQRRNGLTPTPEALCPDDLETQAELRGRIQKRLRLEALLEPPTIGTGDATLPPMPTLDNYDILEVLGHGGMGVVYKARQRNLDRLVALKMILAGPLGSSAELARFRTEGEAVARLQHDNIVRIYEVAERAGHAYLALELVDGGTLAQYLDGKPMAPRKAAELVLTLARAVQHAHEHGIIHRDLKPANILLARAPDRHSDSLPFVPKIADFGLAKRMDVQLNHTQTGAVLGTPNYMAPEQAAGASEIGPAVDIYALGVILYELLTGRPPFSGSSVLQTLEQVRSNDAVSPRLLQPMIPRDLDIICLKCLQKMPQDRYATAGELAADLQAFLEGEPIRARGFSVVGQVARAVQHVSYSEHFGLWSKVILMLAPAPLLVSVIVFLLTWNTPRFPLAMANTTAITMSLVQIIMLAANRGHMRLVPSTQRRQIATVWIGHTIAGLLLWFIIWYATPADHPEQLLLIYPCWMVLVGMAYLGLAAEVGTNYVVGTVCMLMGLLTVFIPHAAPLLLAAFATANITTQGMMLRRMNSRASTATTTPKKETV